tara:strand:+ start:489 stop:5429 length:4941 start_codon:yes stop_codon:yes gene_type:complete
MTNQKPHINDYKDGLNKDFNVESFPSTAYEDAQNVRLFTDGDGATFGAIQNVSGNKQIANISAIIPEIPTEVRIIGICQLRDSIVLFLTENSDQEGGHGYIVEVDFNFQTTNESQTSATLIYDDEDLKFSKLFPIEAIGMFENPNFERIYFTDYQNPTRSINIRDGQVNTYDPSALNFFPNPGIDRPVVDNISVGGALTPGIYSYAYFFTSSGGNTTVLSSISQQIHIVIDDDNQEPTTQTYKGIPEITDDDVVTTKQVSIRVPLNNLPAGTYDTVSLVALQVNDFGEVPIITKVSDTPIAGNLTEVFITHSGDETGGEIIVFEEFVTENVPFKTNKTFGIKDNVLFCANIKGYDIVIPKDIKKGLETYRYEQSSSFTHTDVDGVPDVYNNPFNDESGSRFGLDAINYDTWLNQYQFKYQENSTVLGGTGQYINYKFSLERMEGDSSVNSNANLVTGYNQNQPFETIDIDDGVSYVNRSFRNLASPYKRFLRGYKRGESYRFAIVFFNRAGAASTAQYIGDIKFPEISDTCGSVVGTTFGGTPLNHFPVSLSRGYDSTTGPGDDPNYSDFFSLGVEFNVTLPDEFIINNEISHYQIVRCKRKETDKTRVAQGVISKWYVPSFGQDGAFGGSEITANGAADNPKLFYPIAELQDIPGHLNRYRIHNENESEDPTFGEKNTSFEYDGDQNPNIGGITGDSANTTAPLTTGFDFTLDPDLQSDRKSGIGYGGSRRSIIETSVAYQSAASVPNVVSFFCPEMTYNHFVPQLRDGIDFLRTVGFLTYTTKHNRAIDHIPWGFATGNQRYNFPSALVAYTQWGHTFYSIEDNEDRGSMENGTGPGFLGQFDLVDNRKLFRPKLGSGNNVAALANYPEYNSITNSDRQFFTKALQTSRLNCLTLHEPTHTDLHLSEHNFEEILSMKAMAPKTFTNTPFTSVGDYKCRNLAFEIGNIHVEGAERTRMARHGTHLLCELGRLSETDAWGTDNGSGKFIANDNRFSVLAGVNSVNLAGSAFLIDYTRRITNQYGGNGEQPVSANTFFATSAPIRMTQTNIGTEEITALPVVTNKVFEGDTFVTTYKFFKNFWNNQYNDEGTDRNEESAFNGNNSSTFERVIIPVESTINTELNAGGDGFEGGTYSFGTDDPVSYRLQEHKDVGGISNILTNGTSKAFDYKPVFTEDQVTKLYFTDPPGFKPANVFDVRTFYSNTKILGESADSFTQFGLLNYEDIDPAYGPINRLLNLNDEIVTIQDDAIGVFLINTRELAASESGALITLGTGAGVQDFSYITTQNGGIHQYAAIVANATAYVLDAKRKSLIILKGTAAQDLSKATGLNDYLNENINGIMLLTKEQGGDNPLLGIGATMGYDQLNREVLVSLYTNKIGYNLNNAYGANAFREVEDQSGALAFSANVEVLYLDGQAFLVPAASLDINFSITGVDSSTLENLSLPAFNPLPQDWQSLVNVATDREISRPILKTTAGGSTLVFSEITNKFTSFYSFLPSLYSNHNRNLFSAPLSTDADILYIHNEGNYGEWYGDVEDTSISFIVNSGPLFNKILRFIEYNGTVKDEDGNVIQSVGLNKIRIENDYQDSQELEIDQVHRFRKFRVKLPRDEQGGRFRGTFFKISLFFDNSVNLSLTLQRVMSFFDIQTY